MGATDRPRRELPPGMREQLDLAGISTFGQRPFLTDVEQLDAWQPDVAIVGAPFDVSTTNRPGARFGPRAIRTTAYEPGTYHMDLGLEIFDWLEVVDFGDAHCPHGQTEISHANIRERVAAGRLARHRADHPRRRPLDHVAGGHGRRRRPRLRQRRHRPLRRPRRHGRHHRRQPGQPRHADAPPDRVRRRPRHALRAGRPARLLAAAGHVRVDARAGHDVAHDAGDLGARLQGRDGRRRR